jgi:glycosyltransferase involved in cell wall biosynthesis
VLEFVIDGVNGVVLDAAPAAVGAAITRLHRDRGLAQSFGDAGYDRARTVTWDGVVEKLVTNQS